MKKISYVLLSLLSFFMISGVAFAWTGSSGMDSSACIAFSDTFKTIPRSVGTYEYKYCYRVTCSSGNYSKVNMVYNSGYRCQNGNATPYIASTSDGCSSFSGSCSSSFSTTYCTKVTTVDCGRTSTGATYNDTGATTTTAATTTARATTKVTTTARATTRGTTQQATLRPGTTKKTTTTTVKTTQAETTTETTTEPVDPTNTKVLRLKVDDDELTTFSDDVNVYEIGIPEGKTEVEVKLKLDDSEASYTVEGNKDFGELDPVTIIITVTARDGVTKKTITLNASRYYVKSSDCNLANINIADYNLEFNRKSYEYKLKVNKELTSLDIETLPSDEFQVVEITGNEKLKNNSKVNIEVTAEDGTVCKYVITVKKPTNTWKYILVVIILLCALGAAVYFLLKYLRKSKGQYKYE